MAETKNEIVQHVVIAKFKEDVGPQEIEELVEGYANLVSLIDSIKDFHWGTELSIENLHQGFTHVFVSTFESPAGIPEFVAHQAHIEFADKFAKVVEKFLIVDYKPIILK